ncbi:MAG: tetratricopeptide repeat protein [Gammaproteobacteria bacterium]|nr:tetratricopeptide repeat protein [Gammaproteobacteria bacterium]
MLNNTHLSDEEQAEALKRWWSENGKSIIGGIVVGLGLVFGWQGWNEHQRSQSEMATAEYDRFQLSIMQSNLDAAQVQASKITEDYSATAYDYFVALDLAKALVAKKDFEGARKQLELAIASADDDGLKLIAEARMARLLVAMNETDTARALVNNAQGTPFAGEFAHIDGDIAAVAGDKTSAGVAYQKALDTGAGNKQLLEMKLNETR